MLCRTRRFPSNLVAGGANGGGIYAAGEALNTYFNANNTDIRHLVVSVVVTDPVAPPPSHIRKDNVVGSRSNALIDASCLSGDFLSSVPCILFETTPSTRYDANLAQGIIGCHFDVSTSPTSPAGHWYAFVALDQIWQDPATPDPIHMQACFIMSCTSVVLVPGSSVTCSSSFLAPSAFSSFDIIGNHTAEVMVFPYLALNNV